MVSVLTYNNTTTKWSAAFAIGRFEQRPVISLREILSAVRHELLSVDPHAGLERNEVEARVADASDRAVRRHRLGLDLPDSELAAWLSSDAALRGNVGR